MSETDRPPDDPIAGLTSLLGRQGARLAELEREVAELAKMVAALAEGEAGPRRSRVPWWPEVEPDRRSGVLRELAVWVDEVIRQRHPDLYRGLTPCWHRHPDVVDELTALRAAWRGAYRDPAAPATAAIEWHDRWLPGCLSRAKAAIKNQGCDKGGHNERPVRTDAFLDSTDFESFTADGNGDR